MIIIIIIVVVVITVIDSGKERESHGAFDQGDIRWKSQVCPWVEMMRCRVWVVKSMSIGLCGD